MRGGRVRAVRAYAPPFQRLFSPARPTRTHAAAHTRRGGNRSAKQIKPAHSDERGGGNSGEGSGGRGGNASGGASGGTVPGRKVDVEDELAEMADALMLLHEGA